MTYFYADRLDKQGNRLLTSYAKKAQASKYGGATAKITEGTRFFHISETGQAIPSGDDNGLILRTVMTNANFGGSMEGRFVVFAKVDGKWQRTSFRYPSYSAANSAVKGGLIQLYEACAVIEEEETDENISSNTDSDLDAPF